MSDPYNSSITPITTAILYSTLLLDPISPNQLYDQLYYFDYYILYYYRIVHGFIRNNTHNYTVNCHRL